MDKRHLYVKENFVHTSLVDGGGGIVKDDFGDFGSDEFHPIICSKCSKNITVKQYKSGKLKELDTDDPTMVYEHIKCP